LIEFHYRRISVPATSTEKATAEVFLTKEVAMPDFLRPSIPFIQQGVFLQVDIRIDGAASGLSG